MRIRKLTPALVALGLVAAALIAPAATPAQTPGQASAYVPGELLVGFEDGTERLLEVPAGVGVREAARALRANERVAFAAPNYIAVATWAPNDPGPSGKPKGWRRKQWNFLPCGSDCGQASGPLNYESRGGLNALGAWRTIRRRGRGSGEGARVAVLDSGVAYRSRKPTFRKSPDFARKQFLRGYDFVQNDKLPLDQYGHGTHVAGTIAERTDNGIALTGLAPAAKIIPVRVLNAGGLGTARDITRGIRFAIKRRADVINMSFEFGANVGSCKKVPTICRALISATNRHGVLVVASAGNDGDSTINHPAAVSRVLAVGGTTQGACVADYSDHVSGLDLIAPGGGSSGQVGCQDSSAGSIFQLTFQGFSFRRFGYPGGYHGTSMAAAHASGVAAMVISSGVLGRHPRRLALECQLEATARDSTTELGQPYDSNLMGAGLIDAAAAVAARAPGC